MEKRSVKGIRCSRIEKRVQRKGFRERSVAAVERRVLLRIALTNNTMTATEPSLLVGYQK